MRIDRLGILFLLGAIVLSGTARADTNYCAPGDWICAHIETALQKRHVQMLEGAPKDAMLLRWQRPVAYAVLGLSPDLEARFDQMARDLARLAHLETRKIEPGKEDGLNALFVFSENPRVFAETELARRFFGIDWRPGRYEAMVDADDGSIRYFRSNQREGTAKGQILRCAMIVDQRRIPPYLVELASMQMLYGCLTGTRFSNVVRPSILNHPGMFAGRTLPFTELPPIDRAFLSALYGPNVWPGTRLPVAVRQIADEIHKQGVVVEQGFPSGAEDEQPSGRAIGRPNP